MTLGTSLILIAILALIVLGFRFISKMKKWRLVGLITGLLFFVGILIGASVWGWYLYKDRPQLLKGLGSVTLGMSPVDVSLAIGKPSYEISPDNLENKRVYFYKDYGELFKYYIRFSGSNENPSDVVEVICSDDYSIKVFGLGKYDSEEKVTKKLGTPTSQSIRPDGLVKAISYEKWKVSFEIEKGEVSRICVSSSGEINYKNEYKTDIVADNEILDLKDSPLTTTNTTPTIIGTYSGDYGVKIVIKKDNKVILTDASDHGGMVELSSYESKGGRFSYKVPSELDKGAYSVQVFVFHNIYNDNGYVGDSEPMLTNSGSLTIQ